jgi:hypothetical protein
MSRTWSVIACLLLLCPLFARSGHVYAASSDQPGVSGSSYTSPTYGYSLSWDDSWSVTQASSDNGTDYLELDNGTSSIGVEGYEWSDGAAACVTDTADYLKTEDGVSKFAAAKDSKGKTRKGGDDAKSWALYTAVYTSSDGDVSKLAMYVECRTVAGGDAVVSITQFVASAAYDDEAANRDAVLATLSTGAAGNLNASSGPGGPRTTRGNGGNGTTTSTSSALLDLPAMALLPADIDPNAGLETSQFMSIDKFVSWIGVVANREDAKARFQKLGYVQSWTADTGVPSDPADPNSEVAINFRPIIVEFDSADHAHAAYAMMQNVLLDNKAEANPGNPGVGDESSAYSLTGSAGQIAEVLFRVDRVVVQLAVIASQTSDALTYDQSVAFAQKMKKRVDAALKGAAPGLSQSILRTTIPASLVPGGSIGGFDGYRRVAKTYLQLYGESDAHKQIFANRYGDATEVYYVVLPEMNNTMWVQYEAGIYRFPVETDATAWMIEGYGTGLTADDVNFDTDSLKGSVIVTYTSGSGDSTVHWATVVGVSGKTGFTVTLASPAKSMVDDVIELAKTQRACLTAKGSCAPVDAPDIPAA